MTGRKPPRHGAQSVYHESWHQDTNTTDTDETSQNPLTHDPPNPTRRDFLGDTGRKVSYLAPALLLLTAQSSTAAGSMPCYPNGSPCTASTECCEEHRCDESVCCGDWFKPCDSSSECCGFCGWMVCLG